MRICINCKNEFKNYCKEVACSIRCKILTGIKINEKNCWIWQRSSNNGYYGKLRHKLKWFSTHRAAYQEFVGEIPNKMNVCHKCDTTLCCNPDHLFLGTAKDNRRDAKNKNRLPIGKDSPIAKYSAEQIEEIKLLKEEGFTYMRLKRIFNCRPSYLVQIIKNRTRKKD